jgi:purine-binding chemotaxis protein CheW
MPANRQYCTFYLGEQCYGLDVLAVQEVVRSQPLTQVPLAHAVVRGLMNLRGQIVTAIDLRRRLDLPPRDNGRESVNVVLQTEDGSVALLVDEVGEVLEVAEEQFERPPETLAGPSRHLILGAYKLPDRLLVILDSKRIVSVPEQTDSKS